MRTFKEAKEWAENQRVANKPDWYNLCQKFSRSCVGASVFGGTAYKAWQSIPAKYRHSGTPKAGSLAYFSNGGAGHVVFVIEDGRAYSNDIKRYGYIDICHWNDPVNRWGMKYLGWIDWTPSGRIDIPIIPPVALLKFRQGKRVYKSKMKLHTRGSDSVWNLALKLKRKGYLEGKVTANYSLRLRRACRRYQKYMGFPKPTGIADYKTIKALGLVWVND